MCVNNLPKVATQWNGGATRDSNRGHRARIPNALTTRALSRTMLWLVGCRTSLPASTLSCISTSRDLLIITADLIISLAGSAQPMTLGRVVRTVHRIVTAWRHDLNNNNSNSCTAAVRQLTAMQVKLNGSHFIYIHLYSP